MLLSGISVIKPLYLLTNNLSNKLTALDVTNLRLINPELWSMNIEIALFQTKLKFKCSKFKKKLRTLYCSAFYFGNLDFGNLFLFWISDFVIRIYIAKSSYFIAGWLNNFFLLTGGYYSFKIAMWLRSGFPISPGRNDWINWWDKDKRIPSYFI